MKKVVVFLICIVFCSCKKHETQPKDYMSLKIDVASKRKYNISDLVLVDSMVVLETTKDCLIGSIDQVETFLNKIYIRSNNSIYIFNSEGDFLSKICKIGKGPDEYLRLSCFRILNDSCITISDYKRQKLIVYKNNGEFIKYEKLDCWPVSFTSIGAKDGVFIYSGISRSKTTGYRLNQYSMPLHKAEKSFFKVSDQEYKNLGFDDAFNFFYKNKNETFFYYSPFNDIYLIRNGEVSKYCFLDFGKYNLPENLLEMDLTDGFSRKFLNENFVPFIFYFSSNNKYSFVEFLHNGSSFAIVPNEKSNSQAKVFSECYDDLFESDSTFSFSRVFSPRSTTDNNQIIGIFSKPEVSQTLNEGISNWISKQNALSQRYMLAPEDMNQNPVLVFYKFKM